MKYIQCSMHSKLLAALHSDPGLTLPDYVVCSMQCAHEKQTRWIGSLELFFRLALPMPHRYLAGNSIRVDRTHDPRPGDFVFELARFGFFFFFF